jgi:serine-type D-Ala-D-Ala carboxypeptidase (penicillin-binding protein 5/6)
VRRLLLVALAALALAQPAVAAPPEVVARSYLVVNGATGEVLAARDAHARVPIASITKLMTVLVALDRARPATPIVVDPQANIVGESSVQLRAGERLSLGDLFKAALIQSANDAAYAIAAGLSRGDVATFVGAMNVKAARLGLRDTHYVRPDGLDAAGHYSSASDVTRLARIAMRKPFVREVVRHRTDVIAGGRRLDTWNDLLGSFPGLIGVKTGHTGGAGWCEVAAARGRGVTIYATILGSPSRAQRNSDLAALLRWGLSRYRVAQVITAGRRYANVETGYGRGPLSLVASSPLRRAVRVGRPLVERVVAAGAVELPVRKGTRLGEVRIFAGRRLVGSTPLVAGRTIERPGALDRAGYYVGRAVAHAWGWVT